MATGTYDESTLPASHRGHPLISTPILRAVPAMMRQACSMSLAFKSANLVSAIFLTWSGLTVPTLVLLGTAEPAAMPAACLSSTAAGGLLVMNSNDRSE